MSIDSKLPLGASKKVLEGRAPKEVLEGRASEEALEGGALAAPIGLDSVTIFTVNCCCDGSCFEGEGDGDGEDDGTDDGTYTHRDLAYLQT